MILYVICLSLFDLFHLESKNDNLWCIYVASNDIISFFYILQFKEVLT